MSHLLSSQLKLISVFDCDQCLTNINKYNVLSHHEFQMIDFPSALVRIIVSICAKAVGRFFVHKLLNIR